MTENKYYIPHKGEQIEVEKVNAIKDLGIKFGPHLKFDQHVA